MTPLEHYESLRTLWKLSIIPYIFGVSPFNKSFRSTSFRSLLISSVIGTSSFTGVWLMSHQHDVRKLLFDTTLIYVTSLATVLRFMHKASVVQEILAHIRSLESNLHGRKTWKPNFFRLYINFLVLFFMFIVQNFFNLYESEPWVLVGWIPNQCLTVMNAVVTCQMNSIFSLFTHHIRCLRDVEDVSQAAHTFNTIHAASGALADLYGPQVLLSVLHSTSMLLINMFFNLNVTYYKTIDKIYMRKLWTISCLMRIADVIIYANALSSAVRKQLKVCRFSKGALDRSPYQSNHRPQMRPGKCPIIDLGPRVAVG